MCRALGDVKFYALVGRRGPTATGPAQRRIGVELILLNYGSGRPVLRMYSIPYKGSTPFRRPPRATACHFGFFLNIQLDGAVLPPLAAVSTNAKSFDQLTSQALAYRRGLAPRRHV